MASIITATTTSGLTQSADNSGVLQLASGVGNLVTIPAVTGTAMVSGAMPAFSAYQSSSQSLTSSTFTKIQFQTEEFDTANAFDSTTNFRFTPLVAGYYQISSTISLNNASGNLLIDLYKNGSELKRGSAVSQIAGIGTYASSSWLVFLNGSTDYLEIYGYQTTGSTISTSSGSFQTYFSGVLVRAA
jgi:hypothetical protein